MKKQTAFRSINTDISVVLSIHNLVTVDMKVRIHAWFCPLMLNKCTGWLKGVILIVQTCHTVRFWLTFYT